MTENLKCVYAKFSIFKKFAQSLIGDRLLERTVKPKLLIARMHDLP
ncbi:MAG: hypothetical protein MGF17_09300 [Trichodesmium sp. MAG_R04]|nr:hypothetical protein [Trichodesmium sp. MAG_R04]